MTTVAEAVRTPYKGLSPFDDTELDALLFFGRERETEIVVANALASRLTVLYGPSGVGKSSLLRAGVVHSLRKLTDMDPIAVAYYSSWAGDPLGGIEEAVRGALTDTFGGDPGEAAGDLADRLDAWTAALGCELCLVLDQFEELFLYHEEGGLLEALPEIVTRPGLRVNVVLGIRDDELAKLDIFKARIPGLFSNYLRLDLLDREAGRAAILGPLDRYNEAADEPVAIEPALVEMVLGEVAAGRIDPGLTGRGAVSDAPEDRTRVETPYLQLVMQKLWEVERERRSPVLRLATLAELGGAQRIVEDHLEHAMAALTPSQRDVAAGMFDHLVTPSGAKIAHGVTDLASFAHVKPSQIEPVLSSLARERILRPTGENGNAGDRYEIYHDVLAGAVLAWRAKHDAEMALVREREASWRRQRRLAIVAGISLTAFALMAFLAAYAISQRSTARHQTAIALVEKANALHDKHVAQAATRSEIQAKLKYKQSAANERRLRIQSDQQQSMLNSQNTQLKATQLQLDQTITALTAKTKLAKDQTTLAQHQTTLAQHQTTLAQHQTTLAKRKTAEALLANQKTTATGLLAQAQAELATDPSLSVQHALDSLKITSLPQSEDVLRTALQKMNVLAEMAAGGTAVQAAYSPDGNRIALADRAGEARIFSVPGGRLLQKVLNGSPLNGLAWAPDGQTLATVASDGKIRIWNLAAPQAPVRVLNQGAPARSVAYSPDGRLLLTSGGSAARLWDTATGVLLHRLPTDRTGRSASFSDDGSLVVTVENGASARIWDASTGAPIQTLTQRAEITSAAFGPNGTLVVTGSRDGTGRIWDSHTGAIKATLEGHTSAILTVAFSRAGDRVATGSADDTARVYNLSGVLIDIVHDLSASIFSVAFAPDGTDFVAASSDGNAVTSGPGIVRQHLIGQSGALRMAVFAPDGTTVATVGGDTLRLWEPYGEPRLSGIHKSAVAATSVSFDPSGAFLASGSADGSVVVQRAQGGPLRTLTIGSPVVSTAWASNGLLLVAGREGKAHLFPGGVRESRALGHGSELVGAALRADGAVAATAGSDGVVRLWDTSSGKQLLALPAAPGLTAVALDPKGRWVATGVGNVVRLYDARSGKERPDLVGHTDIVTGVAFSPDGSQLVSSSRDKDARLWDPQTLKLLKVLHKHSAFVSGVAFSPDGRWIATAGPLKAGIWAAHDSDLPGSFLQYVRGNVTPIASVAFSSRGWELATAARDGSIQVVDCKLCGRLPQLKSYAKARLGSVHR
jgi:WD40 repeat protein